MLNATEIARKAVEVAAEGQASDILLLDIQEPPAFADFFVILSAETTRQINALADGIEETLKGMDVRPYHREGVADSGWVLLDYSDVVVHLFTPLERRFYNLEEIWSRGTSLLRIQ